jgi:hypothetical protein
MLKVDWLAAGVLLIPSNEGSVNDQKSWLEYATFSSQ